MIPRRKKIFNKDITNNSKKFQKLQTKKVHKDHVYAHASTALQEMLRLKRPLEDGLPDYIDLSNDGYQLLEKAMLHNEEIKYLLKKTKILEQNPRYNVYLAKILIADLLWHNGHITTNRNLRVTQILKLYEEQLQEAYRESLAVTKKIFSLPIYVRVNTLLISVEDAIRSFCEEGWNCVPTAQSYLQHLKTVEDLHGNYFTKDFHISELLVFPPDTLFYEHPGYLSGKFVLQDKGSCLSSFLLNPKPESVVVDVGAACGLKTNHIANIMQGRGLIVANDINPKRIECLKEMIDVTQMNCVRIHHGDFITATFEEWFDIQYILLDATSSNSGIFFGPNDVKAKYSMGKMSAITFSLNMLLRIALQKFPSIKRVVYTTCSVYPGEGEEVVDDALRTVGDSFTLLNAREMLWNEWTSLSPSKYLCGNRCIRTVPSSDFCLGYFIAVFERNLSVRVPKYERRFKIGQSVLSKDQVLAVPNSSKPGKKLIVPNTKKYQEKVITGAPIVTKINRKQYGKIKKRREKKRAEAKARKLQLKTEPSTSQDIPATSAQT